MPVDLATLALNFLMRVLASYSLDLRLCYSKLFTKMQTSPMPFYPISAIDIPEGVLQASSQIQPPHLIIVCLMNNGYRTSNAPVPGNDPRRGVAGRDDIGVNSTFGEFASLKVVFALYGLPH